MYCLIFGDDTEWFLIKGGDDMLLLIGFNNAESFYDDTL